MIRLYLILGLHFFYIASFTQKYDAELISQKSTIEISEGSITNNLYYETLLSDKTYKIGEGS